MVRLFSSIVSLLAVALVTAACNADILVGASAREDGGAPSVLTDAATRTDAAVEDADASLRDGDAKVERACGATFPQEGSWITIRTINEVLPSSNSGTLIPGTYVLVERNSYLGGKVGTAEARETIQIRGSDVAGSITRVEERRNAGGDFENLAETGTRFDYEIAAGGIFWRIPACPVQELRYGAFYTATQTTFAIHDPSEQAVRVYARLR